MKSIIEQITIKMENAFSECGYEKKYGMVTASNRPDLCEYQCNGALAAAKQYKKAPVEIAKEVLSKVSDDSAFDMIEAVMPGFINIKLSAAFLADYLTDMMADEKFGYVNPEAGEKIIVDYGGPNVAKPLHVGHLRTAIIGESVKRILKFAGDECLGDTHLGDWGMPMGLIMASMKNSNPDLVYFDDDFKGEYPTEPFFSVSELEEIYPEASKRSKIDPEFKAEAGRITAALQKYHPGYFALWKMIVRVSVDDIKANYDNLGVFFELWKKESDVNDIIPKMIDDFRDRGIAHMDDGALVVDVKVDSDNKNMPPCMLVKSDGAVNYACTDLATLIEREDLFKPDKVIYVVDKRQSLHFEQVFRASRKAGIVRDETELIHIGYGTMNGPDGKPFKTRDGNLPKLKDLIAGITDSAYEKIRENRGIDEEEAKKTAKIVGIAALKYGDLSNQAYKDYVFDIEKFMSFEGNTGPYILYTMVRIKSILAKYAAGGKDAASCSLKEDDGGRLRDESEKNLMLSLSGFPEMMMQAVKEFAPHKICSFIYELSNNFNSFYHEHKIMGEEDEAKQKEWIALCAMTLRMLETNIELLGFEAPDRM